MVAGADLAGSLPIFPAIPGSTLATSSGLPTLRRKQLLFNRLTQPGQVHVYSADCNAGERLRVQSYVPLLPLGGGHVAGLRCHCAKPALQRRCAEVTGGTAGRLQRGGGTASQPLGHTGPRSVDAHAVLSRPRHRHTYAGQWPLLYCYLESQQPNGKIRDPAWQQLVVESPILAAVAAFLVANPRLVWSQPGRRLRCGRGATPGCSVDRQWRAQAASVEKT